MSDLLLEIGTEEIPARLVGRARSDLERRFRGAAGALGIGSGARVSVEATPRRLALFAADLAARQPDRTETLTGPSRKIAFDADGNPTRAAIGFARKAGVAVEALATGAGGKLEVRRLIAGREALGLLAESLPDIVLGLRFPRAMYWAGRGSARFIRPIRWVVAVLDGEIVPCEIAGVPSGNQTWGHRRLGPGPVAVTGADDYVRTLRSHAVILSADERSAKIVRESEALLPAGCRLRRNPRLLETLVYETEHPLALLGQFDPSYLELPDEVLETVMLVHQKYFAVEGGDGALTNRFVAVANSDGDEAGAIRAGHERVLRARFNDARFFWEFDQRSSLAERVEELREVTFQATLGSYWDKTQSNLRVAESLAEALGLDEGTAATARRAVKLAKCDLTTEMVGEFPELQGKIGGLYAAAQGEPQAVAEAVYDHYLPLGAAGPVPRSAAGRVASLADRLATLGGMFGLGLIPTGSKDPLALRRAAFSAIRIVVEGDMELSLDRLVRVAGAGDSAPALRNFLVERLRHWLRDAGGFEPDTVQAVLAACDSVPVDALARARALAQVRGTPDFDALAATFKRVRNILEQAGSQVPADTDPDPALLEPGPETALHESLQAASRSVAASNTGRDYTASLRTIAALRPVLDRYFDTILVMAEDRSVRSNRLAFLARMLENVSTIADFAAVAPDPGGGTAR